MRTAYRASALAALAGLLLLSPGPAGAEPYGGLVVGVAFTRDTDVDQKVFGTATFEDIGFDTSIGSTGSIDFRSLEAPSSPRGGFTRTPGSASGRSSRASRRERRRSTSPPTSAIPTCGWARRRWPVRGSS